MGSSQVKYTIIKDRVEIYKDFTCNLYHYIHHYYIDRESLSRDEDIRNHYSWCYKKVCDEFLEEGIDFSNNTELKEYFYLYYYHQFYKNEKSESIPIDFFEKFWKNVFEIDKQKNKKLFNVLVEIYKIFDKSINSEKNVLELV